MSGVAMQEEGGLRTIANRVASELPNASCVGSALPGSVQASSRVERITRFCDLLLSPIALAFVIPLFVVLALAIKLSDGGPVFFAHRRVGRNGVHFYCLKFRTMVPNADARLRQMLLSNPRLRADWERDRKLRVDPRVTRVGAFLRRSSLDELPQLINVLQGTMSLVGPRPIVEAEIAMYGRYFVNYCAVRPGITGLWQVSGRSDVCFRRRVAMDVIYSRSRSLRTYLFILIMTIPVVLSRRGSY